MTVARHNGRGARRAPHVKVAADDTGFPRALAEWIDGNGRLLTCLLTLRRLGSEGSVAVDAVLGLRRVARVRSSWELWRALIEGAGGETEPLLLRELSLSTIESAQLALWGPWEQFPGLALVTDELVGRGPTSS